jgi:hypothetical protein
MTKSKQITTTKIQNSKPVSVIWYWDLRFVCNLVLGVWDFIDSPPSNRFLNLLIHPLNSKTPAIVTQPMEAIWLQQRRFLRQKISVGKAVKERFNYSSMSDYQHSLPLQSVGSIDQCLTAALKYLQATLTLEGSEMPAHSYLGSKAIHLEKIAKIKPCPAAPILLFQSGLFRMRELQI